MDVSGNNDLASYIHVLSIIPSKVINKLLIKYLNNPNENKTCVLRTPEVLQVSSNW